MSNRKVESTLMTVIITMYSSSPLPLKVELSMMNCSFLRFYIQSALPHFLCRLDTPLKHFTKICAILTKLQRKIFVVVEINILLRYRCIFWSSRIFSSKFFHFECLKIWSIEFLPVIFIEIAFCSHVGLKTTFHRSKIWRFQILRH